MVKSSDQLHSVSYGSRVRAAVSEIPAVAFAQHLKQFWSQSCSTT